jgi:hypothetical protein
MFSSEKDTHRFREKSDQLPKTKKGDPLSSNFKYYHVRFETLSEDDKASFP